MVTYSQRTRKAAFAKWAERQSRKPGFLNFSKEKKGKDMPRQQVPVMKSTFKFPIALSGAYTDPKEIG